MPQSVAVKLSLTGPTFERARALAREAVTAVVYGGPAAEGSLEWVLTEASTNRALGATLSLLLAQMAGSLAGIVAELESRDDDPATDRPFVEQADDMLARAVAVVTEFIDGLSGVDGPT